MDIEVVIISIIIQMEVSKIKEPINRGNKLSDRIGICEGKLNDFYYAVLQPFGNHYAAYVGIPEGNPLWGIHHNTLYELQHIEVPDVNGGINFTGVPCGLRPTVGRLEYYGWDYNHGWDGDFKNGKWVAKEPSKEQVMNDISNCIEWIKESTIQLNNNKIYHPDCPRCNSREDNLA